MVIFDALRVAPQLGIVPCPTSAVIVMKYPPENPGDFHAGVRTGVRMTVLLEIFLFSTTIFDNFFIL